MLTKMTDQERRKGREFLVNEVIRLRDEEHLKHDEAVAWVAARRPSKHGPTFDVQAMHIIYRTEMDRRIDAEVRERLERISEAGEDHHHHA